MATTHNLQLWSKVRGPPSIVHEAQYNIVQLWECLNFSDDLCHSTYVSFAKSLRHCITRGWAHTANVELTKLISLQSAFSHLAHAALGLSARHFITDNKVLHRIQNLRQNMNLLPLNRFFLFIISLAPVMGVLSPWCLTRLKSHCRLYMVHHQHYCPYIIHMQKQGNRTFFTDIGIQYAFHCFLLQEFFLVKLSISCAFIAIVAPVNRQFNNGKLQGRSFRRAVELGKQNRQLEDCHTRIDAWHALTQLHPQHGPQFEEELISGTSDKDILR